jgi:hypothetical protein
MLFSILHIYYQVETANYKVPLIFSLSVFVFYKVVLIRYFTYIKLMTRINSETSKID